MAKSKPARTRSRAGRNASTGMFMMEGMPSGAVVHDKRGKAEKPKASRMLQSKQKTVKPGSAGAHSDQTKKTGKKTGKKAGISDRWSEFDELDDKQIERAVADDEDAAPIGDDGFWKNARVIMPVPKQAISIRIDEDVLTFFKKVGPGYQSRMNAVLRSYMEAKK